MTPGTMASPAPRGAAVNRIASSTAWAWRIRLLALPAGCYARVGSLTSIPPLARETFAKYASP
jgi:hypothetical protein